MLGRRSPEDSSNALAMLKNLIPPQTPRRAHDGPSHVPIPCYFMLRGLYPSHHSGVPAWLRLVRKVALFTWLRPKSHTCMAQGWRKRLPQGLHWVCGREATTLGVRTAIMLA